MSERHWFEPLAEHLGPAYLRYSFTKGTEQEVSFLWDALRLGPGRRVLDVGCGPGRHSLALARRGADVVGVDIAEPFVTLAREAAAGEGLSCRFEVGDARELAFDGEFDAVISLCQGGFGLLGGGADEALVLGRLAAALRPGGRLAVSAFSAPFAVRHLEEGEEFDVATGVLHEVSAVRGAGGDERSFDLWTTCFTPRELRLLVEAAGLEVDALHGGGPGTYGSAVSLDAPEFVLVARRAD